MRCKNKFCIYWEENKCTLQEITLDSSGLCDDCIFVNIEEDFLMQKRKELLNKYASY